MPKPKSKKPGTVAICINVPRKLARRLDRMLADLRRVEEYAFISRSGFLSHALAEWCQILDSPEREPAPAVEVRRRLRPEPRTTPNGMSKLNAEKVRAIRSDSRTFQKIAKDMGVNASTIGRVKNGDTWAWVT